MSEIIIFAGTTEGRELTEFLSRQHVEADVCTATEYGGQLAAGGEGIHVHTGRMDESEMCAFLAARAQGGRAIAVDATHPYAAAVSENIRSACARTGVRYIRLLRESAMDSVRELLGKEGQNGADPVVFVDSVQEAVEFLKGTGGNILVATGSKELARFTALPDFRERVFARVLSTPEAISACRELGFEGRHLICMQGPFTEELNAAMLRQFDAAWMVTKESGSAGGFAEKIRAAQRAGARVVLVGRPVREEGMGPMEVRAELIRALHLQVRRKIAVVGTGMGTEGTLTRDAQRACREAQLLVGAERVLEQFAGYPAHKFASYRPEEIRDFLDVHPEYERVALLQSGDVGFYSGAKRLYEVFAGEDIEVCPGISSAVYLCAKLRVPWEDAKLISLHGRAANAASAVRDHKKVFALAGKGESVRELMENLEYYGMGDLAVTVGENLSYPDERIRTMRVSELAGECVGDLSVLLIENPGAHPAVCHGLRDDVFLRDETPMTKSEVRSVSLSRLCLCRDSVVYDVGAGTGSVSVEAALLATEGRVYAVEKKPEAVRLIRANARKFAEDNLEVVEGCAPEALSPLPAPTHVFIGGSSGNLRQILETVLQKNPTVRIVLNCIALETVAEALACIRSLPLADVDIVSVSAARAKTAGPYHIMMGQNPVYIISAEGTGKENHV